jgi:predicted ATPase
MSTYNGSENDERCADRGLVTRVAIRNYKSIAACDVRPGPLSFLVGPNGVVDPAGGGSPHYYEVEAGQVVRSSIRYPPVCTSDRLLLVPVSSLSEFRPVYDMLTGIEIYQMEIDRIREWQRYDPRPRLKRNGSNLASILADMEGRAADGTRIIKEYLAAAVPSILDFESREMGPRLTVEFRQAGGSPKLSECFLANDMSDGVLRMLGVLVALFQGDRQHGTGPSLVGIEEPETGLHPEAASMLVDALGEASERVQVMVSSHSADLLDEKAVQDDSILAAGFKQGRTNIGPLDAAMRSVIRDRISTAGELLRIGYTSPDPELSVPREDNPFRSRN